MDCEEEFTLQPGNPARKKNVSDGGGDFFGISGHKPAYYNWPLCRQSKPYERSQLRFKTGIIYPNTIPRRSDQQNAGGLPDGDGAGKAVLRQFFLRQDRYERDGNGSGLLDAAPVELLHHAKYARRLLDGVDERRRSRSVG